MEEFKNILRRFLNVAYFFSYAILIAMLASNAWNAKPIKVIDTRSSTITCTGDKSYTDVVVKASDFVTSVANVSATQDAAIRWFCASGETLWPHTNEELQKVYHVIPEQNYKFNYQLVTVGSWWNVLRIWSGGSLFIVLGVESALAIIRYIFDLRLR
jgi:hypothetical protein